jgi:hypothetical protein
MIKLFTVLLLLMVSTLVHGQSVDSLGIDDNRRLNQQESNALNQIIKKRKGKFDFTNKNIAFIGGTSGNIKHTKKEYFDRYVKPVIKGQQKNVCGLIVLTKEEKEKSGGYDALVLSPVKIFTDKHREKAIEKLGGK